MNKAAKTIVALVLLAASGGWLYYYYSSIPAAGETVEHTQPLVCDACEHRWIAEASDPPIKCPSCKAMQGFRAAKCGKPDCGQIVPFKRPKSRSEPPAACKKCGSKAFVEAPPDEMQKP